MKRARLPWPLVAGIVLGLALLVAGIVALFGVIADERALGLAQVDRDEGAVEALVGEHVRASLRASIDEAERTIDGALVDPLGAHDDLGLVEEGQQILPPRAAEASEARATLDAFAREPEPRPAPDAVTPEGIDAQPFAERLRLVRALPAAFEAWLAHRRNFVLRADRDLATTVLALERLHAAGALTPALARALLRDGRDGVTGFFVALLAARARLTRADLEALYARVEPIARALLVRSDDVAAHIAAPEVALPATLLGPSVGTSREPVLAAGWVARADGVRTIARRVDVAALLAEAHARFELGEGVALALAPDPTARASGADALRPIDALTIDARATRWDDARALVRERFLLKAIALGGIAVLALAVCALALSLQRRRAAYLDLRAHLLAAVTHELKTPLASIRAMAETLELRLAEHPGARDYPRRIVAASERLGFLVDNVLSFARLERDAWKPRLAPLALADVAAWLAADPVARAPRPVDLAAHIPAGATLVGDPDLVRLLLSNLLDNAAKYAVADRVRVTLTVTSDARGVHLAVSDDGPGLGALDPARLFEAFERGDARGVRGTGLGLAICRMVMQLHGGRIAIGASSPAGTTFVATFPTPPTTSATSPTSETSATSPSSETSATSTTTPVSAP